MKVKVTILAVAAVVGLSASGVAAQEKSDTVQPEQSAEADDSDVIKCEREAVTGSRARKKRVCLTMAEWRERRAAGSRTADAFLQDASRGFPEGN